MRDGIYTANVPTSYRTFVAVDNQYLFSMSGHWWLLQGKLYFTLSIIATFFTFWQWKQIRK